MALLRYTSDEAAGREGGKDYVGTHHFGFLVDDVERASSSIETAGGRLFMDLPGDGEGLYFEAKFRDPDGIIFDVSGSGWDIEPKGD